MHEVIDFLNQNRTVFLATLDDQDRGAPRVRPVQFQFEQGGRLWFCTSRAKEMFAQLQADPRLELSGAAKNMATIRLKGQAVLDDDLAVKERILAENALVRSIYKDAANPDFTVFSVDHGSAFLFDFSGDPPKTVRF